MNKVDELLKVRGVERGEMRIERKLWGKDNEGNATDDNTAHGLPTNTSLLRPIVTRGRTGSKDKTNDGNTITPLAHGLGARSSARATTNRRREYDRREYDNSQRLGGESWKGGSWV